MGWPDGTTYDPSLTITSFVAVSSGAVAANGLNWVNLYNGSSLVKSTQICGFNVAYGGVWQGKALLRIVTAAGVKIFPFIAYYTEGTDFTAGIAEPLNFPVQVPNIYGYIIQFASNNALDVSGPTLALTELDIIQMG
jgi:hypothetical protein